MVERLIAIAAFTALFVTALCMGAENLSKASLAQSRASRRCAQGLVAQFRSAPVLLEHAISVPGIAPYQVTLKSLAGVVMVNGVAVTLDGLPWAEAIAGRQKVAHDDDMLGVLAGRDVLLVGEGLDDRLTVFAEAAKSLTSVDIWYDAGFIDRVQKELVAKGVERAALAPLVRFYRKHARHLSAGTVYQLPAANGAYDVVLMRRVLNNLAPLARAKAILEIVRVLRRGGIFHVSPEEFAPGELNAIVKAHRNKVALLGEILLKLED